MQFNSSIKKLNVILLLAAAILFSSSSYAQKEEKKVIHPLMGSVIFSLDAGLLIGATDYEDPGVDFIWRGSLEYFFNTYTDHLVGLKFFGGTGNLNGAESDKTPPEFITDLSFLGAGFTYGYRVSENVFPYGSISLSYLQFDPQDINGNKLINNRNEVYSTSDVSFSTEAGIRFLITDFVTLNFTTYYSFSFNDYLDDVEKGTSNDGYYGFMIGSSFALFSDKDSDNDGIADNDDMCPDTPEGIKVTSDGCPEDNDHDGVPDYIDRCKGTPSGVAVYSNGCPVDTDQDGVPDYLDRCKNTPPNVRVSRNGCPTDSDRDGVADYKDLCANTPRNVPVDQNGCPLDSDKDGVPDYRDKCANTDKGIQVGSDGCPLDSDQDGIPDYLDKCPETPKGVKITSEGCSDNFREYILSASTTFEVNKAILSSAAFNELDQLVTTFKIRPNAKWRIEGHTDNFGSSEANRTLSLQRAEAVFNYFVAKGINPDKFEVVGLGEQYPIADNSTAEGRQKNRRVVLIRVE